VSKAVHRDFIRGIRALVIDKDKKPKWQYSLKDALLSAASAMLRPLGKHPLDFMDK
jgi:hypothetical protein